MPRTKKKNKSSKLTIQKRWCTETKTENNMDISEHNSNVAQLSSGDSIFKSEKVSMQEKSVLEQENISDIYDGPSYIIADENALCDIFNKLDQNGSNTVTDIAVSFDGTWLTRGHTSQISVGCVVDTLIGDVIDYEIMSKYCPTCISTKNEIVETTAEYDVWYSGHKNACHMNHIGTSGAMEMKAAAKIWSGSFGMWFLLHNIVI
ncbi:uncharacterized protein TNCV_3518491 [Trichonephila clavipes]|uniref:Mutator-like transposase domain-containing protein n=1 Tax=Trichonephila clavipes TaxID=2585209 RepID=A0A8X6VLF7_TRICX|nr:uncharacterized protein TNCV_3518491 [Trichonephila clavipes]